MRSSATCTLSKLVVQYITRGFDSHAMHLDFADHRPYSPHAYLRQDRAEFGDAVNMSASELEKWLRTEESLDNGWKADGRKESIDHHSGRLIVEIKHKKRADLRDEDYEHMRKVIGYVHRHLAQVGPKVDRERSAWRYSLMNWGHDPLKKR